MRGSRIGIVVGLVAVIAAASAIVVAARDDSGNAPGGSKAVQADHALQAAAPETDYPVPENPTAVVAPGLPADLIEIRSFSETGPDGSTLHARWLADPRQDPQYPAYILSVIVGDGAGARWEASRNEYAQQFGPDAATYFGGSVPAPATVPVNGSDGLVFTSGINGFSQVSWVPRSDVVVTISGLRVPQDQLVDVARGSRLE